MASKGTEFDGKVTALLDRGEEVLDALRSVTNDAEQSKKELADDAQAFLGEVDAAVEKAGIGDIVRPALDHLAQAWLGVLEREVRFLGLLAEIEAIHEEVLKIVST